MKFSYVNKTFGTPCAAAGICLILRQVLLHPIEYVPFPEDAGFAISPGASTKVAMQQQVFSRLPYPYDGQHCGTLRDTAIALLPSRRQNKLFCEKIP
jgi:hypothetical protein